MKSTLKNAQIVFILPSLQQLLHLRNRAGYAAARNYRILTEALIEYEAFKRELIMKYGEPDKGENGEELDTISIKVESPNFKAFCDEMDPFNEIEQELELMTAKYEDVVGRLSGEEILGVDWMLED